MSDRDQSRAERPRRPEQKHEQAPSSRKREEGRKRTRSLEIGAKTEREREKERTGTHRYGRRNLDDVRLLGQYLLGLLAKALDLRLGKELVPRNGSGNA